MNERQWFVATYDAFVADEGHDGATVEKARDAVAHAYADAVESGDVERWVGSLIEEGRQLFDQTVGRERERRKTSLRASMEHLLDALNDATILGVADPALGQSYPLGDGRDKTLRYWTDGDWLGAITARYRNAATVTQAAREFDELAQRIVDELKSRNVKLTGELYQ